MTYVWDTNILLFSLRKAPFFGQLNAKYGFFEPENQTIISSVTVGEIHAIGIRNRWGQRYWDDLSLTLKRLNSYPVTDNKALIKMYAEIDVYSQSQHPILKLPTSARKMGKNDLWIAATAAVHNATLISTDADFDHLDGLFFYFDKIVA